MTKLDNRYRLVVRKMPKDKNELNALLIKFKNGDQEAFEEIYKRCKSHIAFLCSKLCHNKEDIEEIVQDTFMTAFKKADELRSDTFLALLRKIAARGCYQKNKKDNLDSQVFAGLDDISEKMETKEDFLPEEYLSNKERQAELLRIISDLPAKQREMIYLYYYAGINTEEIAKLNNCSSVNVRKILYVARNTIKSKIEGQTKSKTGTYMAGAGVSLTAIFLAEEQAFAAEYVGTGTVEAGTIAALGAAGKIAGTTTAATVTNTVATAAACVIFAGAVFTTAYFTLWQGAEEVEIPEPTAAALIQEEAPEPENPIAEGIIEEETLYIPNNSEYSINMYESYQVYETVEPETTEPVIAETEAAALPQPQPQIPQAEEPPPPETEPEVVDRTREILAALTGAATDRDINNIIARYGFVRIAQVRSTLERQYSFYALNEGSGEIMIGVGIYEDGSPARIKFEHFQNRQRPTHTIDLRDWLYR